MADRHPASQAMELRRSLAANERCDAIEDVFESRFDTSGRWVTPPADLERPFESQRAGELVFECLQRLPETHRNVFVLREIEELDTSEICKILEITVTNMGVLMYRARTRLREFLEKQGWSKR